MKDFVFYFEKLGLRMALRHYGDLMPEGFLRKITFDHLKRIRTHLPEKMKKEVEKEMSARAATLEESFELIPFNFDKFFERF